MKKWILILIPAAILVFLYVFIPGNIVISKPAVFKNNYRGIYRELTDSNNWQKWWPVKIQDGVMQFNGNRYSVKAVTASSVLVDIQMQGLTIPTSIFLVPDAFRNIQVKWVTAVPTSVNPFTRFQRYSAASSLANDLGKLLQSMENFYADTSNVYGVKIKRDFVKDSFLIFTYDSVRGYPSTEKIYSLIGALRDYITASSATATDSPMLNVYTTDSSWYITKVALPTSMALPSKGRISFKWMLGHGNILTADVTGDQKKADAALKSVDNYVHDFELASPAIPFYSLQTNRLTEKDSNKWNTRIYYPVMYYKD